MDGIYILIAFGAGAMFGYSIGFFFARGIYRQPDWSRS